MCGRSVYRVFVPLCFLTLEIGDYYIKVPICVTNYTPSGLALSSIIMQARALLQPGYATERDHTISIIIGGTAAVVTAFTTLLGTIIICRRIISATTDQDVQSRGKYWHIISILVESASLYSLTAVLYAIAIFLSLLPGGTSNAVKNFCLQNYSSALFTVTTVSSIAFPLCPSYFITKSRGLHRLLWLHKSVYVILSAEMEQVQNCFRIYASTFLLQFKMPRKYIQIVTYRLLMMIPVIWKKRRFEYLLKFKFYYCLHV